jgi:hypothetical protein
MLTERDRALRKALYEASSLPAPRPAAAFWQDFRARASLTVQQAAEPAPARGGAALSLRWAAAALALLLLVAAIATLRPSISPRQVAAVVVAPPPAELSKVEEVEVLSDYSSVMIVEDAENGGTVIWVASADTAAPP